MTAAPRITVALPVRDGAATLPRALGSLLAQTCGDWELLVLDDRSRDASQRIALELARVDPRVRVLSADGPAGRAARLSQAIAAARGEFFARMDADDVAYPERLERQLRFLVEHPEVDLVGASMLVFDDDGAARGIRVAPPTHAAIAAAPHHGLKLFHPTWLGRTAWFREHGYWQGTAWCEDQELLFRASRTSRYANLPEPLLGYRESRPRLRPILGGRADFAAAVARSCLRERRVGTAAAAVAGQAAKGLVDVVAVSCRLEGAMQPQRARRASPDVLARWEAVWRASLASWQALGLASGSQPPGEELRALRCLACASPLELDAAGLECGGCGRRYPVVDGTPRMVAARPASEAAVARRTAAGFAYEWERFGVMREEWAQNFADYLRPHTAQSLAGKTVLDVGAGSGRHSFHAAAAGARVVAVDVGDCIDVARRNLPPSVLTVEADAEALPFEPASFDVVLSIGVLHHLPDTERALRSVARFAKPGGHVHVYLYWVPEQRWHRALLRVVDLVRRATVRLPHRVVHALSYPLAALLHAAFVAPQRALRTRPRGRRVAAALPLKTYADYPFGVLVNDQFDRLSAPLERRFTAGEVLAMMQAAGLEDVVVLSNHGWVADGRRPTSPRDAETARA